MCCSHWVFYWPSTGFAHPSWCWPGYLGDEGPILCLGAVPSSSPRLMLGCDWDLVLAIPRRIWHLSPAAPESCIAGRGAGNGVRESATSWAGWGQRLWGSSRGTLRLGSSVGRADGAFCLPKVRKGGLGLLCADPEAGLCWFSCVYNKLALPHVLGRCSRAGVAVGPPVSLSSAWLWENLPEVLTQLLVNDLC